MFEEFKRIGEYLYKEGLVDSHGGDLSVRQGDKILITRRDVMLGDLKEKDLIEVGMEEGSQDGQASSELLVHRAIYKKNPGQAIVHAHPVSAIAVSLTDNKIMPQDTTGSSVIKSAPIVWVRGSANPTEVARLLPSFLSGDNKIAMVKGHGSFAIGSSLEDAFRYTSVIERSCQVIIAVRASGGKKPQREVRDKSRSVMSAGLGVMDRSRERSRFRK